ncbi:LysR family transcriptional regulator [Erwiniaceae bacterium BAC15a-03b]|uniref:LysR family transcriptional regulator n=1 Tax=Winslowiella arboricola TaxID=2978220 RepID=A0A9J6PQV5_9GAMM|nr:LysR family transcriptional regulator [Winslowiella arboricola]MCU5771618.1 LysR family transcriptional regulator [Winslowiella arboricola]MCU5776431.1 LysR family transcriptional regulator [Winslowiella arboricola]
MESKVSNTGNMNYARSDNSSMSINNVDLKLLRVFKCVVDSGGLTSASHELNIGLAAISKQLSDLEIRLGMTLCSRGREGFELTEYGVTVYQATLELFASLNIFRERLHNSRNEVLGDLNISVVDNTISDPQSPVTKAVQQLHNAAPKVNIRLQTAHLDDIEKGLNEERFNCAIAPVYDEKSEFDYYAIYTETSCLYCSNQHPLFSQANNSISVEILKQQKIINHTYVTHRHNNKLFAFNSSKIQAVQVEAVAMLILTGHFIGYLPAHYAERYVQGKKMRAIGPDELQVKTPFCLIIKKGRKINQLITLFMDALGIG